MRGAHTPNPGVSLLEISARPALENVADMGLPFDSNYTRLDCMQESKRGPRAPLSDFSPKRALNAHTHVIYENARSSKSVSCTEQFYLIAWDGAHRQHTHDSMLFFYVFSLARCAL